MTENGASMKAKTPLSYTKTGEAKLDENLNIPIAQTAWKKTVNCF